MTDRSVLDFAACCGPASFEPTSASIQGDCWLRFAQTLVCISHHVSEIKLLRAAGGHRTVLLEPSSGIPFERTLPRCSDACPLVWRKNNECMRATVILFRDFQATTA
jgi:hypothetical protein